MPQELVVRIVGDASSLEKALRESATGAQRFDKQMSRTFRGTIAGSGAFRGLGRSVAFASAGFLGGFGLTAALRSVTDEMSSMQKVAAQTDAVIRSTGGVAGVTAGHVEELGKKLLNLSGVDDELIKNSENLLLTFTNIRNVIGKGNDIFDRATKAALNLSVRFDKDLASSAVLVGKALQDPVRGLTSLQRVGVQFSKSQRTLIKNLVESGNVIEAQKVVLGELEVQTKGAAAAAGQTLSGKLSLLRETVKNVGASILTQYLPAITKVVDRALAWVTNLENQKRVMDDVKQVASVVADVFNVLRGALEGLNKITGSTKRTIELLIGAFIALKGIKLGASLATFAADMGLIGKNAERSAGQVSGLRGQLLNLRNLGAIAVGVTVALAIEQTPQYKEFRKFLEKGPGGGDVSKGRSVADALFGTFQDNLKTVFSTDPDVSPVAALIGLIRKDAKKKLSGQPFKDVGELLAKSLRDAAKLALTKPPGDTSKTPGVDPRFRRQANEAARQRQVDLAQLAVDRAGLTASVTDDLAALRNLNALLKKRIAGGHDTIQLQEQQIQVEKQIADLVRQQAEARAAAAKAARDARQFRLLGFGPGGEDLIPGVKALKGQLRSVTDVIAGSFLDTRKTRGLLGHIRQVLSGGLGSVSSEVRAKIQQILADLKSQLKQSSVDVTRFQKTARGQFAFAGAQPHRPVNVYVQIDGKTVAKATAPHNENELGKRHSQRAHSRRGNR